MIDEVAQQASDLFNQTNGPTGFLIDEVGFRKKGKMSVGVGWQYLGCLGKVDNGQVAVAAGLSQGHHFTPIDMRLFLPEEWDDDIERRKKCGIPEDEKHVSKPDIAKQIIEHALAQQIKFDYVNFDALYGNATSLLAFLESNRIDFIGDIRCNFSLYFGNDREERCRPDKYVSNLLDEDFQELTIRNSTKGALKAKFHYAKVKILTEDEKWLDLILLVRKDEDGKTKYSLSNMSNDHIKDLAKKQAQRVFIEQVFKEGKNLVGFGDYQVRKWTGFHNHMAICMLAMLLILKIKLQYSNQNYTSGTIRKLINLCIWSKMDNMNTAIDVIFEQHCRYHSLLEKVEYQGHET